jgi:hypothetical protein
MNQTRPQHTILGLGINIELDHLVPNSFAGVAAAGFIYFPVNSRRERARD